MKGQQVIRTGPSYWGGLKRTLDFVDTPKTNWMVRKTGGNKRTVNGDEGAKVNFIETTVGRFAYKLVSSGKGQENL